MALCAVLLCFASGCGDAGIPLVKVTGRVTRDGANWPRPGVIYFAPLGKIENIPQRPGKAIFGSDGKFQAGTFATGDGLIPGKYRINIECWEHPPSMDAHAPPAKSHVPANFPSDRSSRFEITIDPQTKGVVELNLDVPMS